MGQLNFEYNINYHPRGAARTISNGTISFIPFNIQDSISLLTLNIAGNGSSANRTLTLSFGLYSLNGISLIIANSLSASMSMDNNLAKFVSLTATSAAQNITPGTWFWGMLFSTGGNANFSIHGQVNVNPANAFAGGFIGGVMTDSTGALPTSIATSDLNITGLDAMFVPYILLNA